MTTIRRPETATIPGAISFRRLEQAMVRFVFSTVAALLLLNGAQAATQTYRSAAGPIQVETVVNGLQYPWALAFLSDGCMLVTERPGRMRIVTADGKLSPPVAGLP